MDVVLTSTAVLKLGYALESPGGLVEPETAAPLPDYTRSGAGWV